MSNIFFKLLLKKYRQNIAAQQAERTKVQTAQTENIFGFNCSKSFYLIGQQFKTQTGLIFTHHR